MYDYIEGRIVHKNPAYIVLDNQGIGYKINISLQTFEKINPLNEVKLPVYLSVKEDSHSLYGFFTEEERSIFRNLISVSGIGTNTAILILSSLSTKDLKNAILSGNVSLLKSIKGIGSKTAQRMLIELQDVLKKEGEVITPGSVLVNNESVQEAVSALVMLGFRKADAEKSIHKVISQHGQSLSIEELIKFTLKTL